MLVIALAPAACGKIAFDPLTDSSIDSSPQPLVHLEMEDPTSTTTFRDSSGHNHDASCTGTRCPQIVPGIRGTAAHFDGIDDVASIPHAPDLDIPTITIAAWTKLDAQPTDYAQIVSRQFGTSASDAWILGYLDPGVPGGAGAPYQVGVHTATETGTACVGSPSTPDVGVWVHVAATYDGATEHLYRNGIEMASRPQLGPIVSDAHAILIAAANNDATGATDEHLTGYRRHRDLRDGAIPRSDRDARSPALTAAKAYRLHRLRVVATRKRRPS